MSVCERDTYIHTHTYTYCIESQDMQPLLAAAQKAADQHAADAKRRLILKSVN